MQVAVVIPSYKVRDHILSVLSRIGPVVSRIYVVDDKCPLESGKLVVERCRDPRVVVLFHDVNQGVGGAMITGYQRALADGAEIIVKLDGDGQMDPELIPQFVSPIVRGVADYTKGNRFHAIENLEGMPFLRIVGNTALSFVNKLSSGYWNVMDPTNGYPAIHASALSAIPLGKIEKRYFFESDMLFRLNTVRAVVRDIPMLAQYGQEKSNLSILKVLCDFPTKYLNRFLKRLFYSYVLRDMNVCSIQLVAGVPMILFGIIYGSYNWYLGSQRNVPAHTGTVMLAVLPVIVGVQLLLAALSYDVANIPDVPLQDALRVRKPLAKVANQFQKVVDE
jgi:glycosyltransferase involved in cell wall biosynthesis